MGCSLPGEETEGDLFQRDEGAGLGVPHFLFVLRSWSLSGTVSLSIRVFDSVRF